MFLSDHKAPHTSIYIVQQLSEFFCQKLVIGPYISSSAISQFAGLKVNIKLRQTDSKIIKYLAIY
jgi:hypothetical protein